MLSIKRCVELTVLLFCIATLDAAGGLLGIWSIEGSARTSLILVELMTLVTLALVSFSVKQWVSLNAISDLQRVIAWLCFIGLALCICGDIINFNLAREYHQHGGIVKHDYLATSVLFFGPGYLAFLAAAMLIAQRKKANKIWVLTPLAVGALIGFISMQHDLMDRAGFFVTILTGNYAVFMGAFGFCSISLVVALGGKNAPITVWIVASGFVLAAIADAIIGHYWLFGNAGQGFYPTVRYVNWVIYIGSQCLLIYMPYVYVKSYRVEDHTA